MDTQTRTHGRYQTYYLPAARSIMTVHYADLSDNDSRAFQRQCLSYDVDLEVKTEDYQNCSVLNQLTPGIANTYVATPGKSFTCVGSGVLSLSSLIGG